MSAREAVARCLFDLDNVRIFGPGEPLRGAWGDVEQSVRAGYLSDAEAVLALPQIAGPLDASSIWNDGDETIDEHRRWLARQLLDSKLSDTEAYGIVAHSPALAAFDAARPDSNAEGGE